METHLSKSKLKHLLAKYYGIITNKIEKIDYSFTDCYIIYSTAKYFVKVFNKCEDALKIQRENELLITLNEAGFKVPNIIKTKDGNIYVGIANHCLFLEKYIEGFSYAEEKMSKDVIINLAKILGKMHFTLNNKYDDSTKELYWKNLDIEKERQNLNSLLNLFKKFPQDSNNALIIESINHKIKMLPELKKMNDMFNGITYLMTHGDYSKRNLLQ